MVKVIYGHHDNYGSSHAANSTSAKLARRICRYGDWGISLSSPFSHTRENDDVETPCDGGLNDAGRSMSGHGGSSTTSSE